MVSFEVDLDFNNLGLSKKLIKKYQKRIKKKPNELNKAIKKLLNKEEIKENIAKNGSKKWTLCECECHIDQDDFGLHCVDCIEDYPNE